MSKIHEEHKIQLIIESFKIRNVVIQNQHRKCIYHLFAIKKEFKLEPY